MMIKVFSTLQSWAENLMECVQFVKNQTHIATQPTSWSHSPFVQWHSVPSTVLLHDSDLRMTHIHSAIQVEAPSNIAQCNLHLRVNLVSDIYRHGLASSSTRLYQCAAIIM